MAMSKYIRINGKVYKAVDANSAIQSLQEGIGILHSILKGANQDIRELENGLNGIRSGKIDGFDWITSSEGKRTLQDIKKFKQVAQLLQY